MLKFLNGWSESKNSKIKDSKTSGKNQWNPLQKKQYYTNLSWDHFFYNRGYVVISNFFMVLWFWRKKGADMAYRFFLHNNVKQ